MLGANGFIGSRVSIRAASRGFHVIALDPFRRGADSDWHPRIKRVAGDATDYSLIERLASRSEVVVDCLPDSNPLESEQLLPDDLVTLQRRKFALAQALEASGGGALYIYLSSGGAVYGNSAKAISSEDDELHPLSAYGKLKVALETQLRNCFDPQRLLIIRPANLYGVPLRARRPQGLVDAALRAALSGSTLPVYGDGLMVRDYLHVDDAADVILQLIDQPIRYSVLNLGTGRGISVLEVLHTVERASGERIAVEHRDSPPGFPRTSVLDINRISSVVENFNPRDLSEGVEQNLGILRMFGG